MLASAFAYLVLDVALLAGVYQMLAHLGKTIDEITREIDNYQGDNLLGHLEEMSAMDYLDEMVDFDPVSELEARFYEIQGESANVELSEFLMQMLDKIEKAHSVLIEKLHEINALLEV